MFGSLAANLASELRAKKSFAELHNEGKKLP